MPFVVVFMPPHIPPLNIATLYSDFHTPITETDCGQMCAPHNPNGTPFCCDICHAVPAVYFQEWEYLQGRTDLWHPWRGDKCQAKPEEIQKLQDETPPSMILLACLGAARCQREYRALSCRQFPFYPYITDDFRFIGLAYEWAFEEQCWVISNLGEVSAAYRRAFIHTFDELFSRWPQEMEAYALRSEEARAWFAARRRRIPLLHRNGGYYLLSPGSERLARIPAEKLPRFGMYRAAAG